MSATGVVLLHGKWDAPPFAIASLAAPLEAAGYEHRITDYPWSLRRRYDAPLATAFDTVCWQIRPLRRAGCTRVVLCGHSLGAAVALAFASAAPAEEHADGLILLAPGHFPERMAAVGHTGTSLETARTHRGQPGRIPLVDTFQGAARSLRIPPDPYLDYFEPAGRLCWPENMRRLDAGMPVLWVVGDQDPAAALGIDYAFSHKKPHPLDRHVCLPTDHAGTPAAASAVVVDWLKRLENTA